jgi:DNA-binding protein HU-beta
MTTKKAPAKTAPAAKKTASVPTKKTVTTKKMTKAELVRLVAEKMEIPTKQSVAFFDLLAETAIQETKKNGEFTIPGLGKLVKAQRAARIGRNPQTGESIKIKTKTTVKFRVAKVAKDAIAPVK